MCGPDMLNNLKDFRSHKLREDLTPSLNPIKHVKTKLANDFDFNNAQAAQERSRALLAKQNAEIQAVNNQTLAEAPVKPVKRNTLLTEPMSTSLLR